MRGAVVVGVGFFLAAAACGDSAGPVVSEVPPTSVVEASTSTMAAATSTTSSSLATTTTVVEAAGPGYGGEVVLGGDQRPSTLNPFAPGGDSFVISYLGQLVHAGVTDVAAPSLERVPELITEVPTLENGGVTVAEDGSMTVRYQIRDEAVWADGTPISGDDLRVTLEALAGVDMPFERRNLYAEASLGEVGPKSFSYTLPSPTLQYLDLFDVVLPAHQVAGTDVVEDWDVEPWVAAGPFVLDEWRTDGDLVFVRNDNYWKTDPATGMQLPYLDRVVWRHHPETQRLLEAFSLRELDVVEPPPVFDVWDVDAVRDQGAEVVIGPGPIWEHFNFQFGVQNRNEDSLNRHLKFRRAVAHAIDRKAILQLAAPVDDAPVSQSYLEAFIPALSTEAWSAYPYDPAESRRLLAELCAELARDCTADPPTVVFSATSNADFRPRVAALLADMLETVGISYEADLEDSSIFFGETLDGGTWDMGMWAWVGEPSLAGAVAIHDVFDPDDPPPEGQNFYRWGTPAVSAAEEEIFNQGPSRLDDEHTQRFRELLAAMRSTVDTVEVAGLLQEAERLLADQMIILPLYRRLSLGAVWADEIAGYVHNPSQVGDTWNVEFWYRLDR